MRSGRKSGEQRTKEHWAKHEQDTKHKEAYFWESTVVSCHNLVHYDTLLQNVTYIITKYDSYFIVKCDKSLLQNAPGFLLQNATVLLEKKQLLQNALILLQNTTVITKSDVYYKMRQHKLL